MFKQSVVLPIVGFTLGAVFSGVLMQTSFFQNVLGASADDEKKPLYWVAPMDANYRRDEPGKSPMGMDLVPVYAEDSSSSEADDGFITISSQVENQLGVKVSPVVEQALNREITLAGFLQYDDTTVQHYHSRTSGWVEKLYVFSVGDKVEKNQKLYDLYSPELVYAQEEFIAAIKTGNAHLLESSHLKLQALGVSQLQIKQLQKSKKVKQRLTFYAEQAGYISNLNVREGMYIQPQVEVMASADLSSIWVIAEAFESQSSWLKVGLPVTMKVDAFAGQAWQGKVDYIFPNLNASNRTLQVRVVFDNHDLLLKPNMFAQLSIQTLPTAKHTLVPNDAVIYSGDGARLVLALGSGQYRSVNVTTGLQAQGLTQILSGVDVGQNVVTSAQFLIDSESNIKAELSRMETPEKLDPDTSLDRVWIKGKILGIQADSLKLEHEAVEKWQWPAMIMSLPVHSELDISQLHEGDEIGFCLDEFANKHYVITHIEVEPLSDSMPEMEHGEIRND